MSNPKRYGNDGERPLILASASPRRKWLLSQIGLEFEIRPPQVEESPVVQALSGPAIEAQVIELAKAKAAAAAAGQMGAGGLIIGADTVVLIDGHVLGKPSGPGEAAAMLRRLSGRSHEVCTGVTVLDLASGRVESGAERTKVTFVELAEAWIQKYVATDEPLDKAGAYAVQGLGSIFIERVEGCYFNVVGLPLALLARLLRRHGCEVVEAW